MPRECPTHGWQCGRLCLYEIDQRFRSWRCKRMPRLPTEGKLRFVDVLEIIPQYPQRLRRQLADAVETLDTRKVRYPPR